MKQCLTVVFLVMGLAALSLCVGCDEEDANESPVGPDISGDWSGVYTVAGGGAVALDASITQNGRATFIQTTLPDMGRLLTGRMNGAGYMLLTDAYDGEAWTSLEPVTPNRVIIGDYVAVGSRELKIIELSR